MSRPVNRHDGRGGRDDGPGGSDETDRGIRRRPRTAPRDVPTGRSSQPAALRRRRFLGAAAAAGALGTAGAVGLPPLLGGAPPAGQGASDRDGLDAGADPVVIASASRAGALDPALAGDTESQRICRQLFEPLLGVDSESGATVPLLAESWSVSDDGLRYAFDLRRHVRFHDGTALTADVVTRNVRRWSRLDSLYGEQDLAHRPGLPFPSVFGGFAGSPDCAFDSVEADGESSVIIHLKEPLVFLPEALTHPGFGIASADTLDDDDPGRISREAAGTGAYRLRSAEADRTLLEAFPDYWGEAPPVPRVTVRSIPRSFDRLRELQRGEVDVYDFITAETLRPLVQSGRLILQRDPFSVLYLGFNLAHPALRDRDLRRGIALAIDRQVLTDRCFLSGSRPAQQFVPPALGVDAEDATGSEYDPDRARRLISRSSYDGEPLRFYYPIRATRAYLPRPEAVFATIAADLTAAGLHIQAEPVPWDEGYLDALLDDDDRAMHLLGRNGGFRSAHSFLGPLFAEEDPEFHYDSPTVRRLLRRARREQDDEKRQDLYRRVAVELAENLPATPLTFPISAVALGERIADYPISPVLDELFREITPA